MLANDPATMWGIWARSSNATSLRGIRHRSQFVNFGTTGGGGDGHSAVASGTDDVLRVVQTLMAAQVITGGQGIGRATPSYDVDPPGTRPPPALPPQARKPRS